MSKYIKLSINVQNIINEYLLPSKFIIKYLKNTIDQDLREYFVKTIFCSLEFKFVCNNNGKYTRYTNLNNLKYKFIHDTEPFWTMRLKENF